MITVHWLEKEPNQTDWEYEFYGLSTDPKPNDPKVAVNSLLCELDTGDFYYLKSKNPFVWEKVGSGGSEPSGDGYEINNPTLTVTVSNTTLLEDPLLRSFIDNDGYLSYEQFTPSNGDTYTTLVFANDGNDGDYTYNVPDPSATSNEVNCIYDDGESKITITDPSKDASITLSWMMG